LKVLIRPQQGRKRKNEQSLKSYVDGRSFLLLSTPVDEPLPINLKDRSEVPSSLHGDSFDCFASREALSLKLVKFRLLTEQSGSGKRTTMEDVRKELGLVGGSHPLMPGDPVDEESEIFEKTMTKKSFFRVPEFVDKEAAEIIHNKHGLLVEEGG
jgi:hypothetical protein